jgi:uncharacterized protein YkwD
VIRALPTLLLVFSLPAAAQETASFTLEQRAAYRTPDQDAVGETPTTAAVLAQHPRTILSDGLNRIATALAASVDRPISSELDREMLHRAGVPNPGLMVASLATTEAGDTDLLDTIDRILEDNPGLTHVGWGRAQDQRANGRWQLFVLGQIRRAGLDGPFPTTAPPGTAVPLHFRLDPHQYDPSVLHQVDDGPLHRIAPELRTDGGWAATIIVPDGATRLSLQVVAVSPDGPAPVLSMVVHVGSSWTERPPTFTVPLDASLEPIASTGLAARRMLDLVNRARIDQGLTEVEEDPTLSAVAEDHSRDMVANRFLAHRSPVTGGLTDRLDAAGLHALIAVENIARDPSLDDAHRQLMASPGHRANILHPDVTHAGVGVVEEIREDGPRHWVVTVVMTRPFEPLTAPQAETALLELLDRRRSDAGRPLLIRSTVLDAAAAEISRGLSADGSWRDEAFENARRWLAERDVAFSHLRADLVVGREVADLQSYEGGLGTGVQSVGISARTFHDSAGNAYVVACLLFMDS